MASRRGHPPAQRLGVGLQRGERGRDALAREQAAQQRADGGQARVHPAEEGAVGAQRRELGQALAQAVADCEVRSAPGTATWTCSPQTSWRRATGPNSRRVWSYTGPRLSSPPARRTGAPRLRRRRSATRRRPRGRGARRGAPGGRPHRRRRRADELNLGRGQLALEPRVAVDGGQDLAGRGTRSCVTASRKSTPPPPARRSGPRARRSAPAAPRRAGRRALGAGGGDDIGRPAALRG